MLYEKVCIMKTCCFTGHRILPKNTTDEVKKRLAKELDRLVADGYTEFISGMALGFDTLAAKMVLKKRKAGLPLRLVCALPCKNQDKLWTHTQKREYAGVLQAADAVVTVSQTEYTAGCMQKRNRYMVDRADLVVACLYHSRGGTLQTVTYAQKQGKPVINVGGFQAVVISPEG